MNYKLSSFFIKLSEDKGLIENNGSGIVEVAIVPSSQSPVENLKTNILIHPNGKTIYECKEGEIAYARAVTHIFSSKINVLEVDENNQSCDLEDRLLTQKEAQDIINKYL